MTLLLVGRRYRHAEDLLDRVANLVDLLQRGQEVDSARSLPVIELLAVEVHFEPAAVGRGEGDRRLAIVDRRQLGRHTDGHGEIPSDDAVDDLDVHLPFGHGVLLWNWCSACYRYPRGRAIAARCRREGREIAHGLGDGHAARTALLRR